MVKPNGRRPNRGGRNGKRAAIYTRYSTDFQQSTEDQVRDCSEWANQHGLELVQTFSDEGVTGKKKSRPGLDALKQALANDEIDVVIVFATSRLFRDLLECLQFVVKEVVDRGKRCVFVHSGIDTADNKASDWRLQLTMLGAMDEYMIRAASKHINAAHEGLLIQRRVYGTIPLGYRGEPIEGSLGRHGRILRMLAIDPEQRIWVERIFEWFVRLRMNLTEIARRLKAEGAPLPPKCGPKGWTRTAVKLLLENRRYIGEWSYGTKQSNWQSEKSYYKQTLRDEPLRTVQFEELRIIDDVAFARAQERLAELEGNAGRPPKDGNRSTRPKVLNQLLFCAAHPEQALHAGGSNGRHMICPVCKSDVDPYLYSMLPRRLTLELVCKRLAELLLSDDNLVSEFILRAQQTIDSLGRPEPARIDSLEQQITRLTSQVRFILQNLGESEEDQNESQRQLRMHRKERDSLRRQLAELHRQITQTTVIPDESQLRLECQRLGEILANAAGSENSDEAAAAYNLIRTLTGGRILVSQAGERKRKRGYLRLNFEVNRFAPLREAVGSACSDESISIEIDVKPVDYTSRDLERIQPLFDSDMLICDVAKKTGLRRGYVSKLWQLHAEGNGLETDGRKRRARLSRKLSVTTVHESISEQAQKLAQEDESTSAIAEACNVSWPTANRALRQHHATHGSYREVQRTKQQALRDRIVEKFDSGSQLKDIASAVERTTKTVRKILRTWFESKGEPMPDLRGRRHAITSGQSEMGTREPELPDARRAG